MSLWCSSLSGGRLRVLRVPGRRLLEALHLHLGRSARHRRVGQAGRRLLDGDVRRRRRRTHAGDRNTQGPHLRALIGGGHRHVAGRQISGPGQVAFAAQRLAQERCLSQDRRAGLAGDGEGDEQRAGDGDPRDLPVVLHARAVCAETGLHPSPVRLRARPSQAAGRRVHPGHPMQ